MPDDLTPEELEFLSSLTNTRGYQPVAEEGADNSVPPAPPPGRAGVSGLEAEETPQT